MTLLTLSQWAKSNGMSVSEARKLFRLVNELLEDKCDQCGGLGITDNHVTGEVECSACEGTGVKL